MYKKGVAPAPKVTVHASDPRLAPNVVFVLGGVFTWRLSDDLAASYEGS